MAMIDKGPCPFPGCIMRIDRHGLCRGHADQRRRGRELAPIKKGPGRILPETTDQADGVSFTFQIVSPKYGAFTITAPIRFKGAVIARSWHVEYCSDRATGRQFQVSGYFPDRDGRGRGPWQLHRFIWKLMGRAPVPLIDHVDGNPLNNAEENLRDGTGCNSINVVARRANNTSGYRGVRWIGRRCKWIAEIGLGGRRKFLGSYDTREAAAKAYDDAALLIHGEFAMPNDATRAPRKGRAK